MMICSLAVGGETNIMNIITITVFMNCCTQYTHTSHYQVMHQWLVIMDSTVNSHDYIL